jgi:DNA primase
VGRIGENSGVAIPQSFLQELLSRIDVVEVVGRYVQLKKGGANFMGLCPFHGEKSPSFSVSPTKQFFHCFGCGKSGDALGFLMEHAGMTFIEAVKDLAQQVGMVVPEEDQSPEERARAAEQRQKQNSLTDVLEKAGESYRQHLKAAPKAVAYLKGRGLSGQIAKRFGLGYAPEGWRSLASVFPNYDDPLLAESGLVIVNDEDSKRYDRFRDRVMFPIRNIKGECIGFGGRVMGDGTPKYLNSPETPVFHKGRELYGLFEAREALHAAGFVLVTEGYMDVVALAQLGFPNAVATLGTACTPDHVQKLFRFTDAVVFGFDGDAAGLRAARKALDGALPYATDVRSIKFLFLPAEHDPDSYIREFGREGFAQCVAQATPLSRFLIEVAKEGCDLDTAEGRAHLSSNAAPLWRLLPDGALKRQLLGELAALIQLPTTELGALWHVQAEKSLTRSSPRAAPGSGGGNGNGSGSLGGRAEYEMSEAAGLSEPLDLYASSADLSRFKPAQRSPSPWKKDANGKWRKEDLPPPTMGPRSAPASRADHASRLVLGNMALWDSLTGEDHAMLCALPAPHGTLFAWLESQFHDHGPLAWSALDAELQTQRFAALARKLMATHQPVDPNTDSTVSPEEARHELRQLLNLMLIDRLHQLQTQALTEAESLKDPQALARWRSLDKRRKELLSAGLSAEIQTGF